MTNREKQFLKWILETANKEKINFLSLIDKEDLKEV